MCPCVCCGSLGAFGVITDHPAVNTWAYLLGTKDVPEWHAVSGYMLQVSEVFYWDSSLVTCFTGGPGGSSAWSYVFSFLYVVGLSLRGVLFSIFTTVFIRETGL